MVRVVRVPFLLAWPPKKFAAQVLLPNTVLVRRGVVLTPVLLAHELAHVDQLARLGLLRYWWRYLTLLARHGYHHHPMELEAHAYSLTPEGLERATQHPEVNT